MNADLNLPGSDLYGHIQNSKAIIEGGGKELSESSKSFSLFKRTFPVNEFKLSYKTGSEEKAFYFDKAKLCTLLNSQYKKDFQLEPKDVEKIFTECLVKLEKEEFPSFDDYFNQLNTSYATEVLKLSSSKNALPTNSPQEKNLSTPDSDLTSRLKKDVHQYTQKLNEEQKSLDSSRSKPTNEPQSFQALEKSIQKKEENIQYLKNMIALAETELASILENSTETKLPLDNQTNTTSIKSKLEQTLNDAKNSEITKAQIKLKAQETKTASIRAELTEKTKENEKKYLRKDTKREKSLRIELQDSLDIEDLLRSQLKGLESSKEEDQTRTTSTEVSSESDDEI